MPELGVAPGVIPDHDDDVGVVIKQYVAAGGGIRRVVGWQRLRQKAPLLAAAIGL